MTGNVRDVRYDRGFGFVKGDDGHDYFFHWTSIEGNAPDRFDRLNVDDRVNFDGDLAARKGPRVTRLTVVTRDVAPDAS